MARRSGPSTTTWWHGTAWMRSAGSSWARAHLVDVEGRLQTRQWDDDAGKWTASGYTNRARSGHTATPLPDGRVLVAGGGFAAGRT
jgi:hypothetical protein